MLKTKKIGLDKINNYLSLLLKLLVMRNGCGVFLMIKIIHSKNNLVKYSKNQILHKDLEVLDLANIEVGLDEDKVFLIE